MSPTFHRVIRRPYPVMRFHELAEIFESHQSTVIVIHQPVLHLTFPIIYALDALHGESCLHLVSSDE